MAQEGGGGRQSRGTEDYDADSPATTVQVGAVPNSPEVEEPREEELSREEQMAKELESMRKIIEELQGRVLPPATWSYAPRTLEVASPRAVQSAPARMEESSWGDDSWRGWSGWWQGEGGWNSGQDWTSGQGWISGQDGVWKDQEESWKEWKWIGEEEKILPPAGSSCSLASTVPLPIGEVATSGGTPAKDQEEVYRFRADAVKSLPKLAIEGGGGDRSLQLDAWRQDIATSIGAW